MISRLAYQFEKLERDTLRRAAGSPLPEGWDAGRTERVRQSRTDFFFFCKAYFPDYITAPFNAIHRRMIADALRSDAKLCVYSAPRAFGKTTLFRLFKIWCGLFGKKHFYAKVSDTIDLGKKDFREVRFELKYNPRLTADFGELISDVDNAYEFQVKPHAENPRGSTFVALSSTVTARGLLSKGVRLDCIEIDDFEDYATSINPDISREKLEIIERDFLPALASTGSAVLLGNNARTTCIINLLAEMSDVDRAALHPSIELNIIDAWDEQHKRPTWHERYTFQTEDEMREAFQVSPSVWSAEYRQRPMPPEGARFRLQDWRTYDKLPSDAKGIMFCDPAFGESSDDKAIAVLLWSPSKRKFYAPDAFTRQCGWKEYFAIGSIYREERKTKKTE